MARIIMCGSFKGGVGKTASSWNLAYSLAEMGKRVLAVDFDSQAKSDNLLRSRRSSVCTGDDWTSDDESAGR